MAALLVDWAVRSSTDTILDPSFGGLVFLGEADRRLRQLGVEHPERQLFGADLDEEAFDYASDVPAQGATLVHRDFLRIVPDGRLLPRATAVVGNPPYVRYQSFKAGRERGRAVAERHGVRLTRLASSWAPLLIHAADFVEEGGRLAQVLPAELVHAQYAADVLGCICDRFARVMVAMFDRHVFPGAQEEVLLLLAEGRGGHTTGVEVLSAQDLDTLKIPAERGPATKIDAEHKLLAGLLDPAAVAAYDRLVASAATRRLGEVASVDIGAVTGANNFFVRSAEDVSDLPPDALRPAISKAMHIRGARFTDLDLAQMDDRAAPARLLVLTPTHYDDPSVRALIADGERREIHGRYKCRIRDPWWVLPAAQVRDVPQLFLTYMSSEAPRLVSNDAGALSTNTVHGLRLHNGTDPRGLAASFYSSLTMLSAELVGRSYGGGVLKLEPTEAERLVVPRPSPNHGRLMDAVDELVRAQRYDDVARLVDESVLIGDLGIAAEDVALLRNAVGRLRGRRQSRAKRTKLTA
jgi:adenine-specific DNA-methyltransferase